MVSLLSNKFCIFCLHLLWKRKVFRLLPHRPPDPELVLSSKSDTQLCESYHAGTANGTVKWEGTPPLVLLTGTQKEGGVGVHSAEGLS